MKKSDLTKENSSGYVLNLYIAGTTPRSVRALETVRKLCNGILAGRHSLNVIDIYQNPEAARQDQILAIPTLVKRSPAPERVLIGDLADYQSLIHRLDISG